MDAIEIVERVMTLHWDLAACRCWLCVAGRNLGCGPRERYLGYALDEIRIWDLNSGGPRRERGIYP
jgi:hypothetical protein